MFELKLILVAVACVTGLASLVILLLAHLALKALEEADQNTIALFHNPEMSRGTKVLEK